MKSTEKTPYTRSIPPWSAPGQWQTANDTMALTVIQHRNRLRDARSLAAQIRRRIQRLGPLMNALCNGTCSACVDNCCQRATVWFDFKDLLYLHLAQEPQPQEQLIAAAHETCRYLKPRGCTLPRTQRPFVCSWFICAAQKKGSNAWPQSHQQFLSNSLEAIKKGRKKMEEFFIQAVTI